MPQPDRPIFTDEGVEYLQLRRPREEYVRQAEKEFQGRDVTWSQVSARAWELQRAAERRA